VVNVLGGCAEGGGGCGGGCGGGVLEVVPKELEAVSKAVEVVMKVVGGCAERDGGCGGGRAERGWTSCRTWLDVVPNVVEVMPNVMDVVPMVLGDCADGAWRLCRRWWKLC